MALSLEGFQLFVMSLAVGFDAAPVRLTVRWLGRGTYGRRTKASSPGPRGVDRPSGEIIVGSTGRLMGHL